MAINTISGFNIGSKEPVDTRMTAATAIDMEAIVNVYDGLECWVLDEKKKYRYTNNAWMEITDGGSVSVSREEGDAFASVTDAKGNVVNIYDGTNGSDGTSAHVDQYEETDEDGVVHKYIKTWEGDDDSNAEIVEITSGGGGGDMSYSNDGAATVTVGGITKGTSLADFDNFQDVLDAILTPYVALTFNSFASNLTGVYEKGSTQTITSFTANVTAGSKPLTKFTVSSDATYKGDVGSSETNSITGLSEKYSVSATFYGLVSDGTTTAKKTASITFVDPFFMGLTSSSDLTVDDITALTKKVEVKGSKKFEVSPSGEYIVFAYPKEYGALTDIKDQNGFSVLSGDSPAFSKTEMALELSSDTVAAHIVDYYVYITTSAKTQTGMTLTFSF